MKRDYRTERVKMLKAMEYIARQVNDETACEYWAIMGVADGDIKYGDLSDDFDYDDSYLDDETFKDIMNVFMKTMAMALKSGGLYCGGVVSGLG